MCQPSASRAIEPKIEPPAISTTIIAAVRPTTSQVRFSLRSCWAPRKTCSWLQPSSVWLCMRLILLLEVRFDLALQLDRERVALAIDGLADGDPDPTLAEAILLDVGLLLAVELDADAFGEQRLVVVRALGVDGKAVGKFGIVGHTGVMAARPNARKRTGAQGQVAQYLQAHCLESGTRN